MSDPYATPSSSPEPGDVQPPPPTPDGSVPPPYPAGAGTPYPGAGYPPPSAPYAGAAQTPNGETLPGQVPPGQFPYAQTPYEQNPYGQPANPQAPYGQPAYPTPYGPGPYGAYGGPPPGTDGISIAALVTGVACLGVVPLVLGIIGVRRTTRSGQSGKGLAIAGIALGGLQILVGIALAVLFIVAAARGAFDIDTWTSTERGTYYGDNSRLDALWDACDAGDMQACDDLYERSEEGSDYQWFGYSCGERTDDGEYCTRLQYVE